MPRSYIKAISYYLPEHTITNEELNVSFPEWSVDKISKKTGIYERRIAGEKEFSSDMGIRAAEILFNDYQIDRSKIDFILFCTQSPDFLIPTTACILQHKLNIPTTAGALDFNLGCSGYVYGLSLAKGLISAGIASNILLITSETYSKFINSKDKSNRTIFGDAAAASLISSESGFCEIENFELGTNGAGAENLIVKNSGMRNFKKKGIDLYEENNFIRNDNNLYMNGSEIFKFTSQSVPQLIDILLVKSDLKLNEIDLFVFHQANEFMLNFIRNKIGIPQDKFYINLKNCGNTVSSTIPIALIEAYKSNQIKAQNKVLIAGFGVGYSWGGTILKF
jgi:3-oxoacyl-[acyl-carrier-protein] synthase-3